MRNRIFGAIGVIWGGFMLVSAFLQGGPQGSGAYAGRADCGASVCSFAGVGWRLLSGEGAEDRQVAAAF